MENYKISIHAPRTGSDQADGIPAPVVGDFNPRSPHGERLRIVHDDNGIQHFNPRSPHGERQAPLTQQKKSKVISIHAPRTGSDILPFEVIFF